MFRSRYARTLNVIIVFFIAGTLVCNAQIEEQRIPEVKQAAMEQFQRGDYAEALSGLQHLIRQFPRDPMYRYYKGVCLIELDRNLDEAVELLQYASGRDVPSDVYYYLAEAYRKKYDFKQAKKNYIKFDKEASRSETRSMDSKLLIRSADHATEITSVYNPTEVLNLSFINLSDPEQYGQLEGKGGKLMRKPAEFFKEQEERDDLHALMFMPTKVSRGQFVYFSGLQGKDGYQVMRARRGNTGKWTDMKPIDALNTAGNEILPYFDPVSKDIYFASDGRTGLGSFDLYRSHYNDENDSWSEPVNLGFPVNSVYDDYISIPGSDLGMIMLVTARHTKDSAFAAYRLHLVEPRQSLASASPEKIMDVAGLGYAGAESIKSIETHDERLMAEKQTDSKPLPVRTDEAELDREQDHKSEYQSLIKSALHHQGVADSLSELSSNAAVMVRKLDDPDDRWVYQKQILVWNKKSAEEKALADELFARIATHEQGLYPSAVTPDTIINEMIVYKYTMADSINKKAREAFLQSNTDNTSPSGPSDANPPVPEMIPKINQADVNQADTRPEDKVETISKDEDMETGFTIFQESIYTDSRPIPEIKIPPAGTSYRIQLAVFSKTAENNAFGGITPVAYEAIEDRGLIRYYAGNFHRFADAEKALDSIRQNGYADAYIVGWYDGSKMSYEKVRKLEK